MAHEVENMISTKGIVPWHKLGVVVEKELVTSEEIVTALNFDYMVTKRQNSTSLVINGQKVTVKLPDSFSTIRVNKDGSEFVLAGRIGRNYVPIQNTSAFGFFDAITGGGEAIYETAGILKNGRCVFLLAVLPEYIKVLGNPDDAIKQYIILTNWHDGTSCLLAMATDVRVVCNNTLNMALASHTNQIAVRHTADAETRLREAHRVMGIVNQYNEEIGKAFNTLALARVSSDDIMDYIKTLIPMSNDASDVQKNHAVAKRNKVMELVEVGNGATLDTARGTLWGAYNAYAEFVDHYSNFRNDEARANSLLFGAGCNSKQYAFDLALDLAQYRQPLQVAVA